MGIYATRHYWRTCAFVSCVRFATDYWCAAFMISGNSLISELIQRLCDTCRMDKTVANVRTQLLINELCKHFVIGTSDPSPRSLPQVPAPRRKIMSHGNFSSV